MFVWWICWAYCSYLDGDSFTNCSAGVTMNCLVYCECQLEYGTFMCKCFQIMCPPLFNFSLSQINASDLWSVLGERTGLLAHHWNFDVLLRTLSVSELSKNGYLPLPVIFLVLEVMLFSRYMRLLAWQITLKSSLPAYWRGGTVYIPLMTKYDSRLWAYSEWTWWNTAYLFVLANRCQY